MERKEYNSLNEAALQVQLDEAKPIMGGPKVKRTVNQQQQGVIKKHKYNLGTTIANLNRSGVPSTAPIRQNVRNTAASQMSTAASKIRLDAVQWDELDIPDMVLEYFNNYFDGDLNEDTSNEDIMQAVHDLIDLAEAVCDAVGLDEKRIIKPKQKVVPNIKKGSATIKRGEGVPDTFVPPKYAKSAHFPELGTPIRTLKIPAGAKIKKPQITPKIDGSQLPVVGPGQPDYHQM